MATVEPCIIDESDTSVACPPDSFTMSKAQMWTAVKYIVGAIVIGIILYYAYMQFVANLDGFTKDLEPEKSDTAADFNLQSAIEDLKKMQANILSTLSYSS